MKDRTVLRYPSLNTIVRLGDTSSVTDDEVPGVYLALMLFGRGKSKLVQGIMKRQKTHTCLRDSDLSRSLHWFRTLAKRSSEKKRRWPTVPCCLIFHSFKHKYHSTLQWIKSDADSYRWEFYWVKTCRSIPITCFYQRMKACPLGSTCTCRTSPVFSKGYPSPVRNTETIWPLQYSRISFSGLSLWVGKTIQ